MRTEAQKLAERFCGERAPAGVNALQVSFVDGSILTMTWIIADRSADSPTRH